MFRDKINLDYKNREFCQTPSNPPAYGPDNIMKRTSVNKSKRLFKEMLFTLHDNFLSCVWLTSMIMKEIKINTNWYILKYVSSL